MTGLKRETRSEPNSNQLEANDEQPTRGTRCDSSALSSEQGIMSSMQQVIISERRATKKQNDSDKECPEQREASSEQLAANSIEVAAGGELPTAKKQEAQSDEHAAHV